LKSRFHRASTQVFGKTQKHDVPETETSDADSIIEGSMVGTRRRGSDRIEGQQRLVSEGDKQLDDPAEGCRLLSEAYSDLFLQKVDAGMEYSRIEGMQLFQKPDAGGAVHSGNRKGDDARGSIGKLAEPGCCFRILQVGKPSVACGRHRPPREFGDCVVRMQALLMKELVDR
jgi:hypothetical protein